MVSSGLKTPSRARGSAHRLRARYTRVTFFFARVVLSILWWDVFLRRVGLRRLSRRTATERYRRAAQRFRELATRMGGVWIKVGQFLSARLDVLPETITSVLADLQDEVAPEPFEDMRGVIAEEFGSSFEEQFEWFDDQPLASASLGQVHRARLAGGEQVVVKIQRPDIQDLIRVDLGALSTVIGWLKRYRPITRRADLDSLLAEFSRTLWEEVDYLAEAENARRLAKMYADDPSVRIPNVYSSHTTKRVLTLEDVYFIKIIDYEAIESAGVDRSDVANRLFNTYLWQIFIEGFFHADPHPGNLFIEPLDTGGWRLVFVDFGMVGRLTPEMKQGLRDFVVAIGTRDVDRLIQSYQRIGVLLPGADLERIREAEAAMLDYVWGKSVRELIRSHPQQMRQFVREFRDLIYDMPFQMPEDLIYLGRCVAILSGMCTGLDPEFNLFEGLGPFVDQLITDEGGDWLRVLLDLLGKQVRALATLPARIDSTLAKIEGGELLITAKAAPELIKDIHKLTRSINRLVGAVVFAALLLTGSLLYVTGDRVIGGVGLGLALITLLWVLRG